MELTFYDSNGPHVTAKMASTFTPLEASQSLTSVVNRFTHSVDDISVGFITAGFTIPAAIHYYSLSRPLAARANRAALVDLGKLVDLAAQAKAGGQVVRVALVLAQAGLTLLPKLSLVTPNKDNSADAKSCAADAAERAAGDCYRNTRQQRLTQSVSAWSCICNIFYKVLLFHG